MQYCPLRDFGGKHFHCQMSQDLEVTNESVRCWEKISIYITNNIIESTDPLVNLTETKQCMITVKENHQVLTE